jgi:hypothetical protein
MVRVRDVQARARIVVVRRAVVLATVKISMVESMSICHQWNQRKNGTRPLIILKTFRKDTLTYGSVFKCRRRCFWRRLSLPLDEHDLLARRFFLAKIFVVIRFAAVIPLYSSPIVAHRSPIASIPSHRNLDQLQNKHQHKTQHIIPLLY